jgi:RNA polymerase sigma-70 factor (ECF subfamily)
LSSSEEGDPKDLNRLIDLMIGYQKGDLEAFEGLYRILRRKLYGYLVSLTLNPVEAEELLQETFLQLHRSRRTYQPRRPVMPWAFAIGRHVFLMHQRSKLRRQKHLEEEPEHLGEIPVFPEAEELAEKDLVRKALKQLSQQQREALLLHHVWGFSLKEIGALLGIRKGTAKLRVYRGMLTLRQQVGADK